MVSTPWGYVKYSGKDTNYMRFNLTLSNDNIFSVLGRRNTFMAVPAQIRAHDISSVGEMNYILIYIN